MGVKSLRRRAAIFNSLSNILSVILHPLLMPTLTFGIIFYFCPEAINLSSDVRINLIWMILITTFLFPFISTFVLFYVLKRSFSINDLQMENAKERFFPFLFTGFFYSAITYMFVKSGLDANMTAIMGGISITVILVALITLFWKISAHAVGISGVLGYTMVIAYFYPFKILMVPIVIVLLLTGFLMSARLYLNSHTVAQVYIGVLFGFISSITTFLFFHWAGLSIIYRLIQ